MPSQDRRIDRAERLVGRSLVQLGDDLREARFQAGLSQRELVAPIGLSHSALSRIERGERETFRIGRSSGSPASLAWTSRFGPIRVGTRSATRRELALLRRLRSRFGAGARMAT